MFSVFFLFFFRSVVEDPVKIGSYVKRFQHLMHFEEIQMEYDIRKYDMEAVTMNVSSDNRRLLVLEVIIYIFLAYLTHRIM